LGIFCSGLRHRANAKAGFDFDTVMTPVFCQPFFAAVDQNETVVADPASIARRMATDASARSCKPTPVPSKMVISSSLVRPA
jgi:hypothetical protein